jgi:hypothetical protein
MVIVSKGGMKDKCNVIFSPVYRENCLPHCAGDLNPAEKLACQLVNSQRKDSGSPGLV